MENFELCERLVNKTGVSFAQAKDALERSSWDALDAMILLEEEGKIPSAGGRYSSDGSVSAGTADGGSQPRVENVEVDPRDVSVRPAGDRTQEREQRKAKAKADLKDFCGRVGAFLSGNRLIAYNNVGKEVLNVPIWIAIVLFIFTFWISIFLILFSFIKGWQYRFAGPELGKDAVNKAADAVGSAVNHAAQDIKETIEKNKNA